MNMAILNIMSIVALFFCTTTAFNVNVIPSRTRNVNICNNKKIDYKDNYLNRAFLKEYSSKHNRFFAAFMSSNEFDDEDKKKENKIFTRDTVHK
jgi:hypothetical protein